MSNYEPFTLDDMKKVLSEPSWQYSITGYEWMAQRLFNKPDSPNQREDLAIRVYTSIKARAENSRGKGQDCIKIIGIRLPSAKFTCHQPLVKTSRVYRTKGWEARVTAAIKQIVPIVWDRRDWKPRSD